MVLVIGLLAVALSSSAESRQEPEDVVATVDGKEILYEEIDFDPKNFEFQIRARISTGEIDQAEVSSEQDIEQARLEKEKQALAHKIEGLVAKQVVEQFGIEVNDEEVLQRIEEMVPAEAVSQLREDFTRLLKALEAVYEEGRDPKEVYPEALSSEQQKVLSQLSGKDRQKFQEMEELQWEMQLYEYRDPGKRQMLKDSLALGTEDLNNSFRRGFKALLVSEKLDALRDRQIATIHPEYDSFLEFLEEHLPIVQVDPSNPLHLEVKRVYTTVERWRQCWWEARYDEVKIEIVEDRLAGALDLLFKERERCAEF